MKTYEETLLNAPLSAENGFLNWLGELRREAYERFKAQGFPTRKLESWRNMDLASFSRNLATNILSV